MNQEFAYNILDILQTMWDAAKQMEQSYRAGKIEVFHSLSMDLWDSLVAVQAVVREEVQDDKRIRLADACTCAMESLKDIKLKLVTNPEKAEWKLAYELEPIIETAAAQFYYWAIVAENPEKWGEFQSFLESTETYGLLKDKEKHIYQCDLVVQVMAYNHLDYTRDCVESVLKNLPKDIKTEIHLYNHGSTDDTKEYFDSIENENTYVLNIAVNWAMPGAINKSVSRGKYYMLVSNDILIGRNALENLYRCAAEHADYGYIVPTTPAVSNFQSIHADYKSWEEFEKFTENNNKYDTKRHEQRARLFNPVCIMPSLLWEQMTLDMYQEIFCSKRPMYSFPDDRFSLWMRRHGYKNILMKDAYCHHFGSVTVKEEVDQQQEQSKIYREGREEFFRCYDIDPWGTGHCYETQLFDVWEIPRRDGISVLGLNCGIGSNSLRVKEILKEKGGHDITLYNGTQKQCYVEDLRGISDHAFFFSKLSDIVTETGKRKFYYVIVNEPIQDISQEELIHKLQEAGIRFRELAYKRPDGQWVLFILE